MASLFVLLAISGCAAYQYFKGTLLKSFALFVTAICATVAAFGYFELLANFLISREKFVPWAQTMSFSLLFLLAFIIFQAIASQLTRQPVDTGLWPERIGRVAFGILSGFVISGIILTALVMAPLSSKLPYQRFDAKNPNAAKPSRVLLNADGFTTGWFSIISSGSFSGKTSFAAVHPGFLDQTFLNRLASSDNIPIVAGSKAIEAPPKAAWPAPEGLKDSNGKVLSPKTGYEFIIVRIGIRSSAIKYGNTFTLSQLRLVCKQKGGVENPLAGRGKNLYPTGYLIAAKQVEIKQLSDQIRLESSDFDNGVRWIDFVFETPSGSLPILVEFKQNSIAQLPPPLPADQAPPAIPFISLSKCTSFSAEVNPVSSAAVYGIELAEAVKGLAALSLDIKNQTQWQAAQTDRSIKPAQFESGKISYVRAELKTAKPAAETAETGTPQAAGNISAMLKPLDGYTLLSLKCNNPSAGTSVKAKQLPVLAGLSDSIHYPVGVVASGKIGDQLVYEFDYCSAPAKDGAAGLVIAQDGSIAQPFPDTVWLTEQAQSVSEFYVLYLVKSGQNIVIISVHPGESQVSAGFKSYEGFLIK